MRARFESMGKANEEENRKQVEMERKRRQEQEQREKEKAAQWEEVRIMITNCLESLDGGSAVNSDVVIQR